jgi:glycosyltransferase involved in cell wall biosynthesis
MGTISVLVNCYNYGHYVSEAIESALAQSYPPAEIVVVDDGSTDGTPLILEERYGNHPIVKILSKRNEGQLSAFVAGMEAASGDLICFLDADDKYERNHLENVANAFSGHKDVDFLFTAHRMFGEADGVVQYAPQDLSLGFSLIAALKDRTYVGSVTSTFAMRRSLALLLLPVLRQAAPRWRVRADDCLVYGASLAGCKKYYIAAPTMLYRIHVGNDHLLRERTFEHDVEYRYTHGLRRDTFIQLNGRPPRARPRGPTAGALGVPFHRAAYPGAVPCLRSTESKVS